MRRIFALLVGINKHQSPVFSVLDYAVNDANAMRDLLMSVYQVPSENITLLKDEEANVMAIREALQNLQDNERIRRNDTVLFYYAGHGTRTNAPEDWPATRNKKIQILPFYDFDPNISHNAEEPLLAQPGCGIMDFEFGKLFEDIGKTKGGLHLVAILDSCYSGSATRDANTDLTFRGVELPDDYKVSSGALSALSALSPHHSSRSHILLAACREDEKASESQTLKHGRLTYAVLKVLRNANLRELTYSELIMKIRQPQVGFSNKQTPQLEGYGLNRVVFTEEFREFQPAIYKVQAEGDFFILEGGTRDHIDKGAQFSLHTDKHCTTDTQVTCIEALEVEPTTTRCSLSPGHSATQPLVSRDASFYAIQTLYGNFLRLYIHQEDPHCSKWISVIRNHTHDIKIRSITLAKDDEEADLALNTDGETIEFEVKNQICRAYGLSRLPCRDVRADGPPELLLKILGHASNFFRLLSLSTVDDSRGPNIEVECLSVRPGRYPSSWVREPNSSNLNVNNRIYINLDDKQAYYGFEIKNHYDSECFYVAVFMFDVYSLEIIRYDLPVEQAHSSNPRCELSPLPAKQSLRIGIGDSGSSPRRYFCPNDGTGIDIGFLKIFLATEPHIFPGIEQGSPFPRQHSRGDGHIFDVAHTHARVNYFFSITIPVIQGPPSWLQKMGMPAPPMSG